MRSPITFVIPIILFVLTALTSFVMYQQTVSVADNNIRAYVERQLKLDITRLQSILYNYLSEHTIADAQLNISVTAMNPSMQALVLADENNKIIAANRYIWANNIASDVVDYDIAIANTVKNSNSPVIFYDEHRSHILNGYYPVILQLETGEVAKNKIGILFSQIDIKYELVNSQRVALKQFLTISGSMLFISLIVAMLLHKLISKRLNKLALASEKIANGDYETEVKIKGNDEISHLAKSFNKMGNHIREAFDSRDKAENKLIQLNESLEDRINERTELLKEAQHIAQMGNWVWHVTSNKVYWSDEVYTIFGKPPDKFEPSLENFMSTVHPEDIPKLQEAIEVSFDKKQKYKIEHRIILPDDSIRWLKGEGIPSFDAEGNRDRITGVVYDITDAKAALEEKQKLEHEIQQMQKMESLGQLTGGIAHDFNNMLAIILGYTELSKDIALTYEDENLIKYLEQIEISGNRSTSLVKKMLAFSRINDNLVNDDNISVRTMLTEVSDMLQPILSSSIALNIIESNDDYIINADLVMLVQMLMNLCVNAKDAMINGQGQIDIDVKKVSLEDMTCSSCFKEIQGEYIQIAVSDNGTGISQEQRNRIFEPFFTTKGVGKGTGLGLSMVHGLMHKYGGHLILDSKENAGSTFKLLFPVVQLDENKNVLEHEPDIHDNDDIGKGRILVVDDEIAIASFLKEYLELNGFHVDIINNSLEALDYFKENKHMINLVITDFTMPGLNGLQLAEEMLKDVPDLSILLCSGYSEHVNEAKAKDMNIKQYINKPIDTKQLLNAIKEHIQ